MVGYLLSIIKVESSNVRMIKMYSTKLNLASQSIKND
jgi:hypothetical protein